ncbi:calpastatin [Aeromicrobium sp. Root344]|uniref:DUF1810 domain-containing protein n=1 Tax=Aeromicrobium sp. Root344 TaxID=1736521 RepID=UPI0006F9EDAF|nr:DUF1810 domain-containing protein [Aeromicrobium sp. Root344]KQV73924.1 calpastatin [Aeromicrobium sp. Root344]
MTDPYDLQRFVDAQDGGTYDRALAELRAGRKTSHWMWFVFPQVAGLGRSEMALRYAIATLDEAGAYATHEVLWPRYAACCEALAGLGDVAMPDVLGPVDAQKLHSSLTLFAQVAAHPTIALLIERHFGGEPDAATISLLRPVPPR